MVLHYHMISLRSKSEKQLTSLHQILILIILTKLNEIPLMFDEEANENKVEK